MNTKKTWLQSTVQTLLEFSLEMFAVLFTSFDQSQFPGGQGGNGGGSEKELKQAFQLFDLTLKQARDKPEETRTLLKKSWKKLSLKHHPDRNQSSDEAVKKTQEINHSYELCETELDRVEGKQDEHVHDEPDPDASSETMPPRRRHENSNSNSAQTKYGNDYESERERQRNEEKRARRAWKEQAKEAEKANRAYKQHAHEVQRESQDIQRAQKKAQKQQLRGKNKRERASVIAERLDPQQTLDNADKEFWQASLASYVPGVTSASEENKEEPQPTPKHSTFENCFHPLAVALRLGHVDVIHEILSDQAARDVSSQAFSNPNRFFDEESIQGAMREAMHESMLSTLDGDGNTLMHYIAYYESMDGFSFAVQASSGDYVDLMFKTNNRGQLAQEMVRASANTDFKDTMDRYMDSAKEAIKDRAISRQMWKAAKRFYDLVKCINVFKILHFAMAFGVGRRLFGRGIIFSLFPCIFLLFGGHVTFFAAHLSLHLGLSLLGFLGVSWSAVLNYGWLVALIAIGVHLCVGRGSMLLANIFLAASVTLFQACGIAIKFLTLFIGRKGKGLIAKYANMLSVAQRDCLILVAYTAVAFGIQNYIWPLVVTGLSGSASDLDDEQQPVAQTPPAVHVDALEKAKQLFDSTFTDDEEL